MTITELEDWWKSLSVPQKTSIARKAYTKGHDASAKGMESYPLCTEWWNGLSYERQEKLYKHCTDSHGMVIDDIDEGFTYSY